MRIRIQNIIRTVIAGCYLSISFMASSMDSNNIFIFEWYLSTWPEYMIKQTLSKLFIFLMVSEFLLENNPATPVKKL